ncbi:uncharacterized protein MAM_07260 [Metarhizium album ARSEF 1941]|uniref:Uncharacterized protein n=1 Tax=Metarhizium album (strain ARSEF 1941) TaxID=1081103 RepID=A0A0B2WFV6_METAS|nr:uncharacterized protein MAM_07260 [Metarhizium album ARSEF 1941]KHN94841.1 hypothetical protein MAM_07260 [Metarhizium album ARSEF 1941]
MWSAKLPKARFPSRPDALVPLTAMPARPFCISARLLAAKKKSTPATSSQVHKPHPTESEEDVAADRSPLDPLDAPKAGNVKAEAAAGSGKAKSSSSGQKPKTESK